MIFRPLRRRVSDDLVKKKKIVRHVVRDVCRIPSYKLEPGMCEAYCEIPSHIKAREWEEEEACRERGGHT